MADDDKIQNEPVEELFEGMKKKKKKSSKNKSSTDDLVGNEAAESSTGVVDAADEDPEALFADLKKKKKKKSKESRAEGDTGAADISEEDMEGAFKGKKKKKKRPDVADFEAQMKAQDEEQQAEAAEKSNQNRSGTNAEYVDENGEHDYSYDELLTRFYKLIREHNPELAGEKKKYIIVPPAVSREGSKKTAFSNLVDICKRMRRNPDHVVQYLFTELGTTGSIDGSQRLVIKGRFQQKQIENLLKRYIMEYVTCKTCKSADTLLTKENRLYFVQCESCGSSRTVTTIKSGFMAQTGKRAAQRAAAG